MDIVSIDTRMKIDLPTSREDKIKIKKFFKSKNLRMGRVAMNLILKFIKDNEKAMAGGEPNDQPQ